MSSSIETYVAADRENDPPMEVYSSTDDYTNSPIAMEKRVQSRIAQPSYRLRLKAKLEERQEKVKVHERQVKESARLESCSLTSASIAVGIEEDATCLTPAGTVMDSMCLMPAGTVVDSTCPKPAMPHDSVISDDVFMGEWATSQAMPACAVGHDMLSSSVPLGDTHWSEVIDQAAFFNSNDMTTTLSPAELFCALDTQHASQGPPGRATSCSASGALPTFGLENSFYPPQNLHDSSLNREAQHRFTAYAADMPQDEDRWDVDVPASAQERIRYIVDRATAVGFDTFDEAVAAYYTKKFEDTSLLCVDQRLSRNQQLPQLLSTLHNAAKDWSEWERRGFQEQIIQNAEEALVEELSSYITRRPMRASNTGSTKNHFRGEKYGSGIDFKRRREIQDDLPNLWALVMALLVKANGLNQDIHPDAVLAVIETLCFGR